MMSLDEAKYVISKEVGRAMSEVKNKDKGLISINDDILYLKNNDIIQRVILHFGFPFPLSSHELEIDLDESLLGCEIFFRGEYTRKTQHFNMMSYFEGFNIHVENFINYSEMAKVVYQNSSNYREAIYVDPHNTPEGTNIGDSYISLFFYYQFKQAFNLEKISLASNSYSHLPSYLNSENVNFDRVDDFEFIIISDFVETHNKTTCSVISRLINKDKFALLINGRNLYIYKDGSDIHIKRLNVADPILYKKGVDDYMIECCRPFVPEITTPINRVKYPREIKSILINPFTSTELRDLDPLLVINIINKVTSLFPEIMVYISKGCNGKKESKWLQEFSILRSSNTSFVENTSSIKDLHPYIKSSDIVITADTAISHACLELNKLNITIYRMRYWDLSSTQSLAEIFTRLNANLVPSCYFEDAEKTSNDVVELINYFLSPSSNDIDFVRSVKFHIDQIPTLNVVEFVNCINDIKNILLSCKKNGKYLGLITFPLDVISSISIEYENRFHISYLLRASNLYKNG